MSSFKQRFSLFMLTLFLCSVLTVEPEYVRGYENDDFSVSVGKDAVFALCEDAFTIPTGHFLVAERISFLYAHPRPVSWHIVSDITPRGPPVISLIL
jgi:hypothetical protein